MSLFQCRNYVLNSSVLGGDTSHVQRGSNKAWVVHQLVEDQADTRGRGGVDQPSIIIGSDSVEFALSFVYSGSEVSNTGEFLTEQELASGLMRDFYKLLWASHESPHAPSCIFKTPRSSLCAKIRPFSKTFASCVHSFESCVLKSCMRRYIGPILCPMTSSPGGPTIPRTITQRRVRWLGHVLMTTLPVI